MIARIAPAKLTGTVPAIASKSVAHRAVIAAALANGTTHIICNTVCDDIEATIGCLVALGARFETVADGFIVHPIPKSQEHGILRALAGSVLDCRESGSTLRFMLPVACALGADATFTGSARLAARPLAPLDAELIAAGCELSGIGAFPLATRGRMRPGRFELPGDVSSQYISGLMLACPLLGQPCEIRVTGRIESKPYIAITLQTLAAFGVRVEVEHEIVSDIEATRYFLDGSPYRTPGEFAVEGDWSNAAFWLCAGAMGTHHITVTGLSLASSQGDRAIMAALSRFGARIRRGTGTATAQPDHLVGFTLSASDVPDLVPVLSAVASVAQGRTIIRDCKRLRLKESDRLATTTQELAALGAHIHIAGNDLVIEGLDELQGGTVDAHNDHRIAMMAAIAATRCAGTVEIHGAEAVRKSYPLFFEHYRLLGGQVELIEG